jgi:hypothetical protein
LNFDTNVFKPRTLSPSSHIQLISSISVLDSVTMSSSRPTKPLALTSSVLLPRVPAHRLVTTLHSVLPTVSSSTWEHLMLSPPQPPASTQVMLQVSARTNPLHRLFPLSPCPLAQQLPLLPRLPPSQLASLAQLPPLTMAPSSAGT